VPDNTIIATNTSSLSITSISSVCKNPERTIGTHFFNPANVMKLVEVIPGLNTKTDVVEKVKTILTALGKIVVLAKDTPGFIVNRIARPFYGEALRIYEEGIAGFATIDWAMKNFGKFPMGPFELMDLIGNDINFKVTNTIYNDTFFDPRYKPSQVQKRLVEANYLGRKTGRGFYHYDDESKNPINEINPELGYEIFFRILSMLINEASDAVFLNVASVVDIDTAMTNGVNYPKGLLKWADDIGIEKVFDNIVMLHEEYSEERYRPSPLLKRMVRNNKSFY
jgi:3-hydroxybutyryl-CoA dehydrogenase